VSHTLNLRLPRGRLSGVIVRSRSPRARLRHRCRCQLDIATPKSGRKDGCLAGELEPAPVAAKEFSTYVISGATVIIDQGHIRADV
jgi:hypothetical protein